MDFQALKHRARSKQTPLIEKSMLGFYSSSHEAAAEPSVLLIPAGQGGETTEKLNTDASHGLTKAQHNVFSKETLQIMNWQGKGPCQTFQGAPPPCSPLTPC